MVEIELYKTLEILQACKNRSMNKKEFIYTKEIDIWGYKMDYMEYYVMRY